MDFPRTGLRRVIVTAEKAVEKETGKQREEREQRESREFQGKSAHASPHALTLLTLRVTLVPMGLEQKRKPGAGSRAPHTPHAVSPTISPGRSNGTDTDREPGADDDVDEDEELLG